MLKSKAVALNSIILTQAFRNIRNETNKLNSSLKREYFSKQIDKAEGDIKATWKTVNKLLNKKSKTTEIPHLDVDGEIITDISKKAEELNKYFVNIGKTLNSNFKKPVNDKNWKVIYLRSIALNRSISSAMEVCQAGTYFQGRPKK